MYSFFRGDGFKVKSKNTYSVLSNTKNEVIAIAKKNQSSYFPDQFGKEYFCINIQVSIQTVKKLKISYFSFFFKIPPKPLDFLKSGYKP